MKQFVAIIILLVLSSCSVIRDEIHSADYNKIAVSSGSLQGTFENVPIKFEREEFRGRSVTTESNYYLWNVFSDGGKLEMLENDNWEKCSIQIDFLTETKAEVKLVYRDSILDNRKIRGKFEDGYFYKRPSFVLVPLVPLIFGYNTSRYRIGLSKNKNLIIEESWNILAFALIADSDTKAQVFSEFTRK